MTKQDIEEQYKEMRWMLRTPPTRPRTLEELLALWDIAMGVGEGNKGPTRCRYFTFANPKMCTLQVEEPCEECGRYEPVDPECLSERENVEVTADCSQQQ